MKKEEENRGGLPPMVPAVRPIGFLHWTIIPWTCQSWPVCMMIRAFHISIAEECDPWLVWWDRALSWGWWSRRIIGILHAKKGGNQGGDLSRAMCILIIGERWIVSGWWGRSHSHCQLVVTEVSSLLIHRILIHSLVVHPTHGHAVFSNPASFGGQINSDLIRG